MEESSLNRQVFDKKQFTDTVNTDFTELGVEKQDPSYFDLDMATIDDFFELYEKFFYDIPKEGETNSHSYILTQSGNYVGFEANNEEFQSLLDEITDLREENLSLRQENTDLLTQAYGDKDSSTLTMLPSTIKKKNDLSSIISDIKNSANRSNTTKDTLGMVSTKSINTKAKTLSTKLSGGH